MRWWTLGLVTLCVPWACGDSDKPNGRDGVGGRAGAAGNAGTGGSSGAAGKFGSGGASGAGAGGGGGASAGASGASAGASGANASGGAGADGSGGASGADAGTAGEAGEAGSGGEAGAGNDPPRPISVAIGYQHACAVRDDGSVFCWGSASEGQLGIGALGGMRLAPAMVAIAGVTQLTAGSNHTCALIAGGVKCWGDNLSGELGNGLLTPINEPRPVDVVGLTDAVAVAAGSIHTCALRRGGTVQCWGRDWEGQLGNGSDDGDDQTTPVDVVGINNAVGLASGDRHSCALIAGGTVKCWGSNSYGQLGDGAVGGQAMSPVDVNGLTGVASLGAGTGSTCAHLTDDSVVCWGWDGRGQLGDGDDDEANEPIPVPVALATGVERLSVGKTHSCAVLPTGTAQCWGWDRDGALGNGAPTADQPIPVDVTDLTGIASITAGVTSSCAITTDARLYCWGRDAEGQVGNGDDGQAIKHTPVLVEGL
jgi:alpha-tubulin suppressor-like RCC1 family protein